MKTQSTTMKNPKADQRNPRKTKAMLRLANGQKQKTNFFAELSKNMVPKTGNKFEDTSLAELLFSDSIAGLKYLNLALSKALGISKKTNFSGNGSWKMALVDGLKLQKLLLDEAENKLEKDGSIHLIQHSKRAIGALRKNKYIHDLL